MKSFIRCGSRGVAGHVTGGPIRVFPKTRSFFQQAARPGMGLKLPMLSHTRNAATNSINATRPRRFRWRRAAITVLGLTAGAYVIDKQFCGSIGARTLRSVYTFTVIAFDYKLNFNEHSDIEKLHWRSAERFFDLLYANKGLYIKLGQAIAVQASVFPVQFQKKFAVLFDGAPEDPWGTTRAVLAAELGEDFEEAIFSEFDRKAVASASIAQVHKARLRSGEEVAVKVQHGDIQSQVAVDLWLYRQLMYFYGYIFDLPIDFCVEYITENLGREVDFVNEAKNGRKLSELVESAGLGSEVHVPRVFDQFVRPRVLITEWIDGISLNDKPGLAEAGFDKRRVMEIFLKLFGRQIFDWGFLHCDPHPGNILMRYRGGVPSRKNTQLVLLDHGLYISESDKFRYEYCELWRALFRLDDEKVKEIVSEWGIGTPEQFASMVMLRPYSGSDKAVEELKRAIKQMTDYERQKYTRDEFRNFLRDTSKIPLELMFIGRTMRMLQSCNQGFGAPVNRVKLLALEASRVLRHRTDVPRRWTTKISEQAGDLLFYSTLALTDLLFYVYRVYQWVFNKQQESLEDLLERQMIEGAREFGIEIQPGVFEG